jgi:hypothetical protein
MASATLFIPPLFWWLAHGQDPTTTLYPLPALILLPALLGLKQVAVVIPVGLLFLWNAQLMDGDARIPKRTLVLLIVATVADALWFAFGWQDGLAVQGARYTHTVFAVNIVWVVFLWLLLLRGRKGQPTVKLTLLLHWMLFMWFAWYAFPFFGALT